MILSKQFKQIFITESKHQFNKTIALLGGSFKFPTIAHWYMVEQYIKKADEVIILISDPVNPKSIRKTSTGTIITAQMAKDIFDIYIKKYNFQNKVKAIISSKPSPVTALYTYIDEKLSDVNVIFGVSKKGGDEQRYKTAEKYYEDNEHIHLLNPLETAVEPYVDKNGQPISATDARNNLENIELLKNYLPEKLNNDDIQKVLSILKVQPVSESNNISKNNLEPCDETESIHLNIIDEMLFNSKIMAYNIGLLTKDENGKDIPVNPKKFPEKAIRICFLINQIPIEIFLDTKTKKWDSLVNYNNNIVRLSPEQMEQFFTSNFYNKLMLKLQNQWPLTDEFYGNLYNGIINREMSIDGVQTPIIKEDNTATTDVQPEIKKKEKPEEITHSATGRKYIKFSDLGVNTSSAVFSCWPKKDNEFRWSQWKDWKKIKPLCRMRFKYSNDHEYGVTLSPISENYDNRGFRSYDLTQQPPLQWLSKKENAKIMKLSIFNKFNKQCIKRIQEYIEMDPEDIFKKINNPEKITVEEIIKTQTIIRKTLNNIIKNKQIDAFKWN